MKPREEWRSIPNFPHYEASSLGNIRRKVGSRYFHRNKAKLKLWPNKDGYLTVGVTGSDGVRRLVMVSRLVAFAFHGIPDFSGAQARHINGDRTDNHPNNLRWGTRLENSADKIRHGTTARGSRAPSAKLRPWQVQVIRSMIGAGLKTGQIAALFSIKAYNVRHIRAGRSWAWLKPPCEAFRQEIIESIALDASMARGKTT